MRPALLADLIAAAHLAYVAFVVVGEVLVVAGGLLRWSWVRNPWFRWLHLLAIAIVVAEALVGLLCPLTTWEADLRREAGQPVSGDSFVARLVHDVMFFDAPPWVFTVSYVAFGLLVAVTMVWVRPRPFRSGDAEPGDG